MLRTGGPHLVDRGPGDLAEIGGHARHRQLAHEARPRDVEQGIDQLLHPASGAPEPPQLATGRLRQLAAPQEDVRRQQHGVERIAQVVAQDPHHPFAKIELLGEPAAGALLLGDVGGGADHTDDPAGVVPQRLARFGVSAAAPPRRNHDRR